MKQELDLKLQVKQILALIQTVAPGKSVELRIPPYAAIQCAWGSTHRRGTPSNVVGMSATALITLTTNPDAWESLCSTREITSGGINSDLSEIFIRFAKLTPDLDGSGLGK
jgi:hypothetical protein